MRPVLGLRVDGENYWAVGY